MAQRTEPRRSALRIEKAGQEILPGLVEASRSRGAWGAAGF